ncbi:MAG: hypothetical protein H0T73_03715 [Ardenticatenales bacterium]|nr:hypothetical protein [Ardenticatenales bacterium]
MTGHLATTPHDALFVLSTVYSPGRYQDPIQSRPIEYKSVDGITGYLLLLQRKLLTLMEKGETAFAMGAISAVIRLLPIAKQGKQPGRIKGDMWDQMGHQKVCLGQG